MSEEREIAFWEIVDSEERLVHESIDEAIKDWMDTIDDPLPTHIEVHGYARIKATVDAIDRDYVSWACEEVTSRTIDLKAWVAKNGVPWSGDPRAEDLAWEGEAMTPRHVKASSLRKWARGRRALHAGQRDLRRWWEEEGSKKCAFCDLYNIGFQACGVCPLQGDDYCHPALVELDIALCDLQFRVKTVRLHMTEMIEAIKAVETPKREVIS